MQASYEQLLKEFHDKYGQFRRGDHENHGPVPIAVALLRLRLITEELGELASAMQSRDRVEIADAIGDLGYVIMGTLVAYGMDRGLVNFYEPGLTYEEIIYVLSANLGTVSCAIHEAVMKPDEEALDRVNISLRTMFMALQTAAQVMDIPFDPVFREVHRSNMTKAVPTISTVHGEKYGKKLGVNGKGPDYQPPNLEAILGEAL